MAMFGSKVSSLEELLEAELADLLDAERQITKALPTMIDTATTPALRTALEHHLRETEGHVQRVEQAFRALGKEPRDQKCDGMAGVRKEGVKTMKEAPASPLLDAAMIGAAQRVEHYEMAGYGTARTFAQQLGRHEVARLLEQTLQEEKAADEKLTQIASQINMQAMSQSRAS
jgi:ferritin-like metal-binding protein YciE